MFIELWERIRGYDKWSKSEATIRSSTLAKIEVGHNRNGTPIMAWQNSCVLVWSDPAGASQLDEFSVFESSPLFQLYEDQKVTILCDPANSGNYFFPELLRTRAIRAIKMTLGFAIFTALVVLWSLLFR
jgi:hypothetical protein